jgi:hypothetical protein
MGPYFSPLVYRSKPGFRARRPYGFGLLGSSKKNEPVL